MVAGLRRVGVPRLRRQRRRPHGGGRPGRRARAPLGHDVELTVAGRTDAGVHARGQVVTFDADAPRPRPRRRWSARSTTSAGRPIAAREAEVVPPEFDARFSARGPPLPLPRAEPAAPRPVPRGHVVARRAAARPLGDGPGLRPVHRRARLRRLLPPAQAPGRVGGVARAPGEGRVVVRRRRRPAALRDRGRRRSATRWCAASSARWSRWPRTAPGRRRRRHHPHRRPLAGRRPRAAPGPHPLVGRPTTAGR